MHPTLKPLRKWFPYTAGKELKVDCRTVDLYVSNNILAAFHIEHVRNTRERNVFTGVCNSVRGSWTGPWTVDLLPSPRTWTVNLYLWAKRCWPPEPWTMNFWSILRVATPQGIWKSQLKWIYSDHYGSLGRERMAMGVVEAIYKLNFFFFLLTKNRGRMAGAQGKTGEFGIN